MLKIWTLPWEDWARCRLVRIQEALMFLHRSILSVRLTRILHLEERNNEQLWRSASNGTESHTSAIDEYNIRQLLCRDAVEALERVSEKDKNVPLPSLGKVNGLPKC
jgi:hypothetical protein